MGEIMKNFIETVTSRSDMITEAFLQHIFLSFVALAIGITHCLASWNAWSPVIVVLQSQSSV